MTTPLPLAILPRPQVHGIANVRAISFFNVPYGKKAKQHSTKAVFPNPVKLAEHLTIKLLGNSSFLEANFIIKHKMLRILTFWGSNSSLLREP